MAAKSSPEEALKSISDGWLKKLDLAYKHKQSFADDAKESMSFFDGPHNWFWKDQYAKGDTGYNKTITPPGFRMQCNRVFEAVKLFASVIYHRSPTRSCTPNRYPPVPPEAVGVMAQDPAMMQQYEALAKQTLMQEDIRKLVSDLMQRMLNYSSTELDLKTHGRRVVDEAIIKGMGVFWTELIEYPNGRRMVGSFADSVDNLLLDPDATEMEDILWCAKRCTHPVDEVAKRYGLDREKLTGNLTRGNSTLENYAATDVGSNTRSKSKNGKTNDLCVYYKIWSKTGLGDRLKNAPKDTRGVFDSLGDNCYIVVAEGVDFPLNMQPDLLAEEVNPETGVPDEMFRAVQWPIPFWAESGGWPFTPLAFHRKPGSVWPISHIKPGIPELRFLCWAFSFLAQRVATSCETLIGVSKAADQDIKDQILSQSEAGFKIVELSEMMGRSVNDVISVFQLPNVTGEIFNVIQAVTEQFDKRVGLTELAYGMTRASMRSATEAQVRAEQISVRPDDMAEAVENTMSLISRREALATRWLLTPEDVEPVLGPLGAMAWQQHVMSLDPSDVVMEFDYRIEAGSARKPNKATKQEQMQMALQTLGPVLQQLIPAGVVDPFNALISDWAETLEIDPRKYLVPPPPPPPQMPPPGMPPQGGGPPMPPEAAGPPPAGLPEPPPEPPEEVPQVPAELNP